MLLISYHCVCTLYQGATIVDKTVAITLDPDYELPPGALASPAVRNTFTISIYFILVTLNISNLVS